MATPNLPIYIERVNPEFIGIAEKYSSHKKNRLQIQHRRNSLLNNLKYKLKVDGSLQKSIDDKSDELSRVKAIKERHEGDLNHKATEHAKRMKMIEDLRQRSTHARNQTRNNIKKALNQTFNRHKHEKQQFSTFYSTIKTQYHTKKQKQLNDNKMRYRSIQTGKKEGRKHVNQFFKEKNLQSLNTYKLLIKQEKQTADKYEHQVKVLQKTIETVDHRIQKKKHHLYDLLDDIGMYTLEPMHRCIPYFLRQDLKESRHSTRPADLILKGSRELMKNSETNVSQQLK